MPRKAKLDSATQAKAARMVAKLREHYRLGHRALKSDLSTKEFADEHGINENTLRKIKAFARTYSPKELNDFVALRRPNGLPLQWGHVPYLLAINDATQRKEWAKQAANYGWTAPQLHEAIPKKYRGKHHHGRRMKEPATAADGLRQLIAESEVLARRLAVVMNIVRRKTAKRGPGYGRLLNDAELALRDLAAQATSAANDLAGK